MAELFAIPVTKIHPHPDNPRKDLGDLSELVESIRNNGIFQNLTVIKNKDDDDFTVIIGHRRLAAAKQAGLLTVPCAIREMDYPEQVRTMLMENMQRSDLTVYEQAEGFQMMLDLGDTVETISSASGFSESTVRRRIKLCRLDREKFKTAVERGGTLFDFAELDQIEDDDEKNELLQYIGTNNFRDRLEKAKAKQKLKARIKEWVSVIDTYAFRIDKKGFYNGETIKMVYWRNYSYYRLKEDAVVPDNASEVRYFYIETPNEVDVYYEYSKSNDAEAEEKNRYNEWLNSIGGKFEDINSRHFNMRLDFVKRITGAKRHSEELVKAAVLRIIDINIAWNSFNFVLFAQLLGIGDYDTNSKLLEDAAFQQKLKEDPFYVMFIVQYCAYENNRNSYFCKRWSSDTMRYYWKHNECPSLDRIYDLLKEFGYEMSDEEIQMQNGTHTLFQEKYYE